MPDGVRIAVDTGGTFTDLCLFDDRAGTMEIAKVPSTPSDPAEAVIAGVRQLMGRLGLRPGEVRFFLHGTTVATNALLEGRGAPTALLTTEGFEDVLLIGRQSRPRLYDFWARRPEPLVPRRRCYGVPERVLYTGEVRKALDEARVTAILEEIRRLGIPSIAVCLLHAYANPVHERRIAELIASIYPEAYTTVSSDILPEYREYERMSTVCINASVMPKVSAYVGHLERMLKDLGIASELYIMQSNGGVITAEAARRASARTVLSGPAGGALTGAFLSNALAAPRVITIDIGGTSSDICLIDGRPGITTEAEIEGYPIRLPMIDINTIGAGGGSIAWIDSGGALRVGPRSAGADPGPACYGKGGTEPTVTDAHALLGRLNPAGLLGGGMPLDLDRARAAIGEKIARPLGLDLRRAAEGILTVVNANMIRGIRRVSVERGHDPRDFDLIPFGGAGPLHGADLAQALRIRRVIVPAFPGIASAFGMLSADVRHDYVRTRIAAADALDPAEVEAAFAEMEALARRQLAQEGFRGEAAALARSADLRYLGQSYELGLPVPAGPFTPAALVQLVSDFHQCHARAYGHAREGEKVEFVNWRVVALGRLPHAEFRRRAPSAVGRPPEPLGRREVVFDGRGYATPVYDRQGIAPGGSLAGPAVIEQLDATTIVPPGFRASAVEGGHLIIECEEV